MTQTQQPIPAKPSRVPWIILGMGIMGLIWAIIAISTALYGFTTRDTKPQIVDCSAFAEFLGVANMPPNMQSATCTELSFPNTFMTAEFVYSEGGLAEWLAGITSNTLQNEGCPDKAWACLTSAPVDIPKNPDAAYLSITYSGIPESTSDIVKMEAFT